MLRILHIGCETHEDIENGEALNGTVPY